VPDVVLTTTMRLKDKIIIVTGSTQGIGEAIARRCVVEGARVVIHGLEPLFGRRVADSLSPSAALLCNDIGQASSADELIDFAIKTYGRIHGLVNNAATTARSTLEETNAEVFDRIININLRAPLLLIRAAAPHLKKTRGAVLNIGSVNAYSGAANLLPYSISKGGLMTLTRNQADALAYDQVRVNQVNLGWTLTANERKLMEGGREPGWLDNPPRWACPSGKLMTPDQVANAAVYWLGDESRPVSGSVLEMEQFPIIGRNNAKEIKTEPQAM
jgi:NAD(P)-dependent dehydrogenase (short-subunit alcohol dehydrogenase family)